MNTRSGVLAGVATGYACSMNQDPWLLQVAVLGGSASRSPSHWREVQRHIVNNFASGQSARYRPGAGPLAQPDPTRGLLARDATDLEVVEHLREAGPLTIAQLAMRMQTAHPVAWERMQGLARRGLVRRTAGAWSATMLCTDAAPRQRLR